METTERKEFCCKAVKNNDDGSDGIIANNNDDNGILEDDNDDDADTLIDDKEIGQIVCDAHCLDDDMEDDVTSVEDNLETEFENAEEEIDCCSEPPFIRRGERRFLKAKDWERAMGRGG